MSIPNKASNAGVHGSTGFEFQKHCALYILFEKYIDIKNRKYFICLEHHDDFLFCYQTNDELVSSIDAYQAKKSSAEWKQGADMYEILKKMAEVGISLKNDTIQKLESYTHNLEFVTNNSIRLSNIKKGKARKSTIINETTSRLKLIELHEEIASVIKTEVQTLLGQNSEGFKELDNLSMAYIDLPKKYKDQKDYLVGIFNGIFGEMVSDHRAAVEALLLLFRDAENTLNSGNIVKLMDESKRVSSERINKAIDIITTKNLAFNLWRAEEKEACKKLKIVISEKRKFESDFINSIDRFKDKKQVEHQKIFSFVNNNKKLLDNFTDEVDCIQFLYEDFLKNASSQLPELSIKAAIFAAYIEVREELWK